MNAASAEIAAASLRCGHSVDPRVFAEISRTMALHHHKWDAQVGDHSALAPFALVLSRPTWEELARLARALASEVAAIEDELCRRPDLHERLGLPRALARTLRATVHTQWTPAAARIMRFDFHPTREGWRVSEVNSDVPGGFTEASCLTSLMAQHTTDVVPTGDPAGAWVAGIERSAGPRGVVALLSAPGWVQDAQVVAHIADRLRERGISAHRVSPHQLRWDDGRARVEADDARGPLDAIVRFYQAEWLARLRCHWQPLFVRGRTPASNPASAVLTESKRLPLLWRELDAGTTTWRRVLPETRDPRQADGLLRTPHGSRETHAQQEWVLKPAFGNEGDDVAMPSATSRADWTARVLRALCRPDRWVAQRRFHVVPLSTPLGKMTACIGVFVVDGRVCGAYGRLSPSAVIDFAAIDAAVLVENERDRQTERR